MEPLPYTPRTFRDIVEADLRRAARLIIKVQDEVDPQWRFATPSGDWHIVATLPKNDDRGRKVILRAIETFMVWKQAQGFVLASELAEPDAVYALGVTPKETQACLARIRRSPRALTPKEVKAMVGWFGVGGKFPAINIMTGEVGAEPLRACGIQTVICNMKDQQSQWAVGHGCA
jgi:hypothetical protein